MAANAWRDKHAWFTGLRCVFVHKLQKYQNTNVLFLESIYYLHGINLLSLERSLAVHEQGPRLASLHN